MKIVGVGVAGMMVGCLSPATERASTQSIEQEAAATYRFFGSVAEEGETCLKPSIYRNSLCGTTFHGYLTIPDMPNPDYANGFYQGSVAPYGMVLHVDGMRPRAFPYVSVSVANNIPNPLTPDDPSLIDTLEISASADYSNDGFSASFMDPTGTAIENEELMPDPVRFSEVCWSSLEGCPLVAGDAAADFRSMELHFSRSSVAISVPREERESPYFGITAADWLDADHTAVTFTLEIFDSFTFATPTCDLWVQLEEAEGAPLHAVQGIVHHDGRGERGAELSIETGAANPARRFTAVNVTCEFAILGESIVEQTLIWF